MGSKEGIIHISLAFLNEGDHVFNSESGLSYVYISDQFSRSVPVYDLKKETSGDRFWKL
jgi:hypothetical protein